MSSAAGWQIRLACRALNSGGLVLHATEGVWGLASDPFDEEAVERLLTLKNRSVDKGLIVIADRAECFTPELDPLEKDQRRTVLGSWPGPVTWVLPNVQFPDWITGGRSTVAVRVSGHPQARALCAAFEGPLVSTSANRSGRPPAVTEIVARRQLAPFGFPGPRDRVLPGRVQRPGAPSEIRTLTGAVLRAGRS
jgi:L-threonylcarbamoyladenylate synthase